MAEKWSHIPDRYYLYERQIIFVGDSYAAGTGLSSPTTTNWARYTAAYMGVTKYWVVGAAGAGFVGQTNAKTFLELLQSLSIADRESVTDIVVCGGWGDRDASSGTLKTAMMDFSEAVYEDYPNARLWLGMISWADGAVVSETDWRAKLLEVLDRYSNAGQYFYAYMGGLEYVMHNYSFFQSDGVNPNASGHYALARQVSSVLNGGTIARTYGETEGNITPAVWGDNGETWNMSDRLSYISRYNGNVSYCEIIIDTSTYTKFIDKDGNETYIYMPSNSTDYSNWYAFADITGGYFLANADTWSGQSFITDELSINLIYGTTTPYNNAAAYCQFKMENRTLYIRFRWARAGSESSDLVVKWVSLSSNYFHPPINLTFSAPTFDC